MDVVDAEAGTPSRPPDPHPGDSCRRSIVVIAHRAGLVNLQCSTWLRCAGGAKLTSVNFRRSRRGIIDHVEDLFRSFGLRPLMRELEGAPTMRIEVSEDEANYMVKAEIPGVKKDDIAIMIDGNQINISAEVKREGEHKEENQVYNERYFGRIQRSFTLPMDVDQDKAHASYDSGVLQLMLPKNPHGTARKLMLS